MSHDKHTCDGMRYILHLALLHCHVGFHCVLFPYLGFQHLKDMTPKINAFPFVLPSRIFRKIFIVN